LLAAQARFERRSQIPQELPRHRDDRFGSVVARLGCRSAIGQTRVRFSNTFAMALRDQVAGDALRDPLDLPGFAGAVPAGGHQGVQQRFLQSAAPAG
jgi:hypothetical protein